MRPGAAGARARLDQLSLAQAGDADGVRVERRRHAGEDHLRRPWLQFDPSLALDLSPVSVHLNPAGSAERRGHRRRRRGRTYSAETGARKRRWGERRTVADFIGKVAEKASALIVRGGNVSTRT